MIPATTSRDLQILMVFTGGTISSRVSDGTFAISDPPYQLLDQSTSDDIHFTVCEPFRILSENMTPDMLFRLFSQISDACSSKIYDGILIAHGTDTMAYTAQLAHILLSGLGIPCILIGSKLPLQNPDSDGAVNFDHAMALFRQVSSGVYVISRSETGISYVHFASKIMQPSSGADDFRSYKDNICSLSSPTCRSSYSSLSGDSSCS
jgi:L-asparaginase/Glu-tRNA(Gln) amidotransferase subunit D